MAVSSSTSALLAEQSGVITHAMSPGPLTATITTARWPWK
jgi:hypothetical protein